MPDGMNLYPCEAHLHYSSFIIHFSLFILKNKNAPGKIQGRKFTRYHLVSQKTRHCEPVRILAWQERGVSAFLDAVTGVPGNGYLSTFQLQDHVQQLPSHPFPATGALWAFPPPTLLFAAFGYTLLIISPTANICQQQILFYPHHASNSSLTN